ncbi:MAG: hypothetical protein J0M12_03120 [Deltaproteobacteria bacterium]|nr:hypothetical protein [Deltaproteobacteria bacterium]
MDILPAYLSGFLAVLLLTSFVKIFTSLHILRAGIGIQGGAFGVVTVALAFALSLFVMGPQLKDFGGVEGLISGSQKGTQHLEERFRPFLEKHTRPDIRSRFAALATKLAAAPSPAPTLSKDGSAGPVAAPKTAEESFASLISAFLVSQLQEAFQLGLIFLIPFVVIDLLVTNVLMALGVVQISAMSVALPLKILLFFAVDGWALVAEKLVGGYAS